MSYGLPPVKSTAAHSSADVGLGATSSTTKSKYTLNPKAPVFVPRAQRVHEHSVKLSNIKDRQAAAFQTLLAQTLTQWREPTDSADITGRINDAYKELRTRKFINAETAFRDILNEYEQTLSTLDYQNATIGLARSLREQTRKKRLEACTLLEKLRLTGSFTEFGASTIHHLDLTLSRCEQALGKYLEAETRLIALRNLKPDADVQALCKPSGNFDADITNARLWQFMEKNTLTETLLMNMGTALFTELQSNRSTVSSQKRHSYLHTVNLALARNWQVTGKYEWAENLLLSMILKHPNTSEEILCSPSVHRDIDLALVRVWQMMGKPERTERLLLNMGGKHPDDSEESLCKPCPHHEINLALARLWQEMDKHEMTGKLLLNMSNKHPDDSEESLCKPCGNHSTDLALARYWELIDKHALSEKLLLNMSGRNPDDSEEILCRPSGHHDIDLTLLRHWDLEGKHKLAEKLVLNMSGKHLCDSLEKLCEPSGQHDIDLALACIWQVTGRNELAERLLLKVIDKDPLASEDILCEPSGHHAIDLALLHLWEAAGRHGLVERLLWRCREFYHSDEFQLSLLCLYAGQSGFMEMVSHYPESANTLLVTSIHYFNLACEQITNDDLKSGKDNLNKALQYVESALEKYPLNAGAHSQKAHCLRMMGASEEVWRAYFDKASLLDSSRAHKNKNSSWRSCESDALQKMLSLKEQINKHEPLCPSDSEA
ncbi:PABP-interacting PAM2 motif-containing protein [Endozoicomonas sp. 8E]|uniref:PABP-interacting PAM2 motif-containing protein n=1 Tax=Endozoicomonas sp. 8E TaxID=3035692 RepID=UPI002938E95B|nr:PABP-interacting PAM2 motif-containing protein [Endozoicomonas sp. 8E]WOG26252.1 PABP-interacting PAM2 motif-containing protein [Endozoicomonas sp. 8E]